MLQIYSVPVATYCAKLRVMMRHKGIAWEELPPPGPPTCCCVLKRARRGGFMTRVWNLLCARYPVVACHATFEAFEVVINPCDFAFGPRGDLIEVIEAKAVHQFFHLWAYTADQFQIVSFATARR